MKQAREEFTLRQTMNMPFVEFHHYYDLTPPEVDFHQHEFYEIYFLLSGDVQYHIEGRTYTLRPGDILLTNNQDIHRPDIRPGKPYERFVIWIDPSFLARAQEFGDDLACCFREADEKQNKMVRPTNDQLIALRQLCERMEEVYARDEYGCQTMRYALLLEFLVLLNLCYHENGAAERPVVTESGKINEVLHYIGEHLDESLSLDDLSGRFYISKTYLNTQFKRYTGLTLYQYIMKKRLTIARNMLRAGDPVMDACFACGFSDYSNFLKAFKREFGKTPKEFMPRR